jgi:hypothetical protein
MRTIARLFAQKPSERLFLQRLNEQKRFAPRTAPNLPYFRLFNAVK